MQLLCVTDLTQMLNGAKTIKFYDANLEVVFEMKVLGGSNGYLHANYGGKEYVLYVNVNENKIQLKPTQDRLPVV